MKKQLYLLLLTSLTTLATAQTYSWQWAKAGGGDTGSGGGPGFYETADEMIRDVVVDNNNNSYYLTKIYPQNPNINGTPVTSYQDSDLLLFSLDCQGNLRWSRTIGGYNDSEFAWNLKVDNDGGLYMMINVANSAHVLSPTRLPIRWGDSDTMPVTTVDFSDNATPDPGLNRIFMLKYNSSNGNLAWAKPLQGAVNRITRDGDNGVWTMDSNKNIHAILGLEAGSHLNGLITVPASFTTSYQYYLVKFNYNNVTGDMVAQPNPLLLPIQGNLGAGWGGGKVQFLYDETLNRYYLAGSTSVSFQDYLPLSYNNTPLSNDGYVLAFDGATGTEVWRKEFTTSANGSINPSPDEKVFSLIKDSSSNIYISGRYVTSIVPPPTFGSMVLPTSGVGEMNFVMKLDQNGNVLWTKIPTSTTSQFGTRSMRAKISLNGNEIAFVKGTRGYEIWDSFSVTSPQNDQANSLLVRLNKDTGNAIGLHPILSAYGTDDELTSVAVDNDGNYVVGGYFHSEIFTDPNDNIPTISYNANGKSQFYVAKLAKSACSAMATAETPVQQTDVNFYPNPVQDILQIKTKEKLLTYEVITADGRLVTQGKFARTYSIDMTGMTTGVYYVKVLGEGFTTTGKVIKK